MRPVRLEISGFTSFREETVVEFEGADYFVLVGPTGSGKSTIIDAICFALYGSVPRYENRNLVAPVVTQGQLEARVRLDFEIGGEPYSVVRRVKRQGRAATSKAQLEKGEEVLAGTADEVTDLVTELIGLSFEHFTKCVVLPQGEFSRFLHDKPATRQDMLVRLLGLDVYERMRARAAGLSSELKTKIEVLEQRIDEDLGGATAESLKEAKARLKKVTDLRKQVGDAMPKLNELQKQIAEAENERAQVENWIAELRALKVPVSMEEFGDRMEHADKRLQEARDALAAREKAMADLLTAKDQLPEKAPLLVAVKAHEDRAALDERIATEKQALEIALAAETKARTAAATAAEAVELTSHAVTAARDEHAALHLATGLKLDEPCPVCLQVVAKMPKHPRATAIEKAEKAAEKAITVHEDALAALTDRSNLKAKHDSALATLIERRDEFDELLKAHPDPAKVQTELKAVVAHDEAEKVARAAESEARKDLSEAQQAVADLKEMREAELNNLNDVRDKLIALQPPTLGRQDLVSDWERLIAWAAEKVPDLEKQVAAASKTIASLDTKTVSLIDGLASSCAECELDLEEGDDILEVVLDELAGAKRIAEQIEKAIADSKKFRVDLDKAKTDHALASALARHLNAAGFERWIIDEAVQRLVQGATAILKELSNGQYSLSVDGHGNFSVTDHHNADETRSAKTLSGGETFLASLSLALSLSDQLMDLAAGGSARLDAIFLDEGFGTLDPETLDTVAATVENLSASGRMVGIVTHVRDLADRVPLQYRVTKDARTSRVERVTV